MTVKVYSGSVLIEQKKFKTVAQAIQWANYFSDEGYKVRLSK